MAGSSPQYTDRRDRSPESTKRRREEGPPMEGDERRRKRRRDESRQTRREKWRATQRPSQGRRRGAEPQGTLTLALALGIVHQHRHRHHHHHHRRRYRERRPSGSHHHHHHAAKRAAAAVAAPPVELPFGARRLSRSAADLAAFRPLLARYLEVQKQLDLAALGAREERGRWKGFVARWNAGDLAEGWYSAEVFQDAAAEWVPPPPGGGGGGGHSYLDAAAAADSDYSGGGAGEGGDGEEVGDSRGADEEEEEEDDEDDGYGPTLPGRGGAATRPHGAGAPSLQDLSLRAEAAADDAASAREQLRRERGLDRQLQRARLEELAPRAEPGTRERQMEKRREAGDAARAFRDRRAEDAAPEVADRDLMGGGDGVADVRRQRENERKRRTDRQIRRDEEERARREEHEERVRKYKAREERSMEALREIARQRFG
ncbi:hypothetical protein GGR56DRAFT_691730 [Xylariaceae sp. FL0804]|nr:hypothetical protein GGR56DRAFT_691730 [Xylariaceae sp. FL0804]